MSNPSNQIQPSILKANDLVVIRDHYVPVQYHAAYDAACWVVGVPMLFYFFLCLVYIKNNKNKFK